MDNENLKVITYYEVEEALAKLLFYVKTSTLYNGYKPYKEIFEKILKIVEKWVEYYVENADLLKISNEEVISINEYMHQIPFEVYQLGNYYEEIDIWLTTVIYYGSCPINEEYNDTLIKRKGEMK